MSSAVSPMRGYLDTERVRLRQLWKLPVNAIDKAVIRSVAGLRVVVSPRD